MTAVRALVFDLFGTLIHLRDAAFQKGIVRLVRAPRREWVEFLRHDLAVRSYGDRERFVEAILERFPPSEPGAARTAALALLERELASAELEPAVRSLLGFLRRRGLKLGLLSNSGSPFREPFERAALGELFDAVVFSCDLGAKKPDPAAYQAVLDALGVRHGEAMMIGDSLANDIRAPIELGMSALLIGESERAAKVESFAELAWLRDFRAADLEPLIRPGQRVTMGGVDGAVKRIDLLPDGVQGRYNLVGIVEVAWDDGLIERLYVKRFRHSEAVWIEEFIRPLLGEVGIATNRVAVMGGAEPLLLAREVQGEKVEPCVPDPGLGFEIGRHGASAYLFANADLRPRNALLTRLAGRPCLTMVDYEYSLFDRALDLSDLPERFDPQALGRRSEAELLARGDRRVVTRAAISRTRRSFFDVRAIDAPTMAACRAGWREVHDAARAAAGRIEERLRSRLEVDPPLIIGTEAYRRAFLPLDVTDLLARIAIEPDAACEYWL